MAFKREVRLVIAPPGTDEGIVISDLDMEFRVTRSNTVAENVAEFVIYGANESTRNDILVEGASVEFSAAYADAGGVANNGVIFRGNVISVEPQKLPTTWQVNIHVSNI
ncbi:MAG: hypothetical protein KAR06_10475, partial [Deltaproteobacteria bacterium]|nr:hypothetical protein [Deltaproteobacteria bacterium]